MPLLWHASEPVNGILRVEINRHDKPVNTFSRQALEELEALITRIRGDSGIRGVVFQSGKPGNFIAGADIDEFREISETANINVADTARDASRYGQRVLQSLEDLKIPTLALVSGACVGGGLEFILACKYRIADEDRKTQIGVPEVLIGLIPGWGGTVRMTRLLGLYQATPLILQGRLLNGRQARSKGLIHDVVPREAFDFVAEKIMSTGGGGLGPRPKPLWVRGLEMTKPGRKYILSQAQKMVLKQTHGHYPAPLMAIETLRVGVEEGEEAQFAAESNAIGQLAGSPVTGELMRLFFVSEAAKKLPESVASQGVEAKGDSIKQAAVIGAGAMGAGIALLMARRGIWTRLKDLNPEFVSRGMQSIRKLVKSDLVRKKITPIEAMNTFDHLSPTTDYHGMKHADVVIEAIVEDVAIKHRMFKELVPAIGEQTVVATNTSSLLLAELAKGLPHPEKLVGLHFFNPPHQMRLVEVVRGATTSPQAIATAWGVVNRLGKTPVLVGDCAGFLVNRLLSPYMNEAGYLLLEVDDPQDIERAAIKFGMPMGPLALMDLVGLDVAGHVSQNMYAAYGDRMAPAAVWTKLRESAGGKPAGGKKLYEKRFGKKRLSRAFVQAIAELKQSSAGRSRVVPSADGITERLIYPIINEAARCLDEGIAEKSDDINLAMVFGTGFAPFRGGPLRFAESIGYERVVSALDRWAADHPRLAPSDALRQMAREQK